MKQVITTLIIILGLLFSLSANAQNIVTGSNLNIGTNNTLSGTSPHGNAIGENHWLEGLFSLAVGRNDTILEVSTGSLTLGTENRICGNGSMAIGNGIKIQGQRNVGIGNEIKVMATSRSMVIGNGLLGSTLKPDMFLENSFENSLMIGFKSIHPTLTVGPSPNNYPSGDTLGKTGKVAIGDVPVTDIAAKLHIRSDYGENAGLILESKDPATSNAFIRMRDAGHGIEVDSLKRMKIKSMDGIQKKPVLIDGIVGINVGSPYYGYMDNAQNTLYVRGGIVTDKVTIKHYGLSWWPDYVFCSDYQLMPLKDLREYITANHHLPNVPSEAEVMENGIELGDMQSVLLEKIEEMTLYLLQQQETIEQLEHRIAELEGE